MGTPYYLTVVESYLSAVPHPLLGGSFFFRLALASPTLWHLGRRGGGLRSHILELPA
ncbi:protein of unknown function [Methylorubrum extorquens]|uniref:Uncharacterized protein n=1 Tax=Methylorubrum extorquens TaxID=408 RepID=A0A2N9AXR9_METEX|nr:protein of unknown function [Methylorubrum extorquens]